MSESKIYRPGFTKGSEERIAKVLKMKQQQQMIPLQIIAALDAFIKMAIMGQVSQFELQVALDPSSPKNVRIVVMPSDFGMVEQDEQGKKIRVVVLQEKTTPMIPMEEKKECVGNPEIPSTT